MDIGLTTNHLSLEFKIIQTSALRCFRSWFFPTRCMKVPKSHHLRWMDRASYTACKLVQRIPHSRWASVRQQHTANPFMAPHYMLDGYWLGRTSSFASRQNNFDSSTVMLRILVFFHTLHEGAKVTSCALDGPCRACHGVVGVGLGHQIFSRWHATLRAARRSQSRIIALD